MRAKGDCIFAQRLYRLRPFVSAFIFFDEARPAGAVEDQE
jgi:hypothetical protein